MPNYLQHIYQTTTKRGKVVAVLDEPITTQDHDADAFIVTVSDAVFSGGRAYGDFVRADGVTIPLSGKVSGDTATVILAPNCYTVPGRFLLTVKVEASGSKTTYLQIEGYAKPSSTDEYAVAGDDSAPIDVILEAAEKAEQVLSAVASKAPAIFVDASGDIVTITDGAEMPVQRLITNIAPAADGSGWDAVKAHRKGKNLVNAKIDATSSNVTANGDNGIIVINGTASASSTSSLKIYEITLKPGTYTMSHKVLSGTADGASASTSVLLYKVDGTTKHRTRLESPSVTFVVTEEETARIEIIRGGSAVTYNAFTFSVQLESGETATDFEPPNVQTLTVNLLEEVTDGEIDWLNGTLTKADGNTVQLEKQNLSTLKGVNNIWSDAGETEVTYIADTKLYINQKIAAVAAAIVNG